MKNAPRVYQHLPHKPSYDLPAGSRSSSLVTLQTIRIARNNFDRYVHFVPKEEEEKKKKRRSADRNTASIWSGKIVSLIAGVINSYTNCQSTDNIDRNAQI